MPEQGLVLEPRVTQRIMEVQLYLVEMERERAGWGVESMREVGDTARSFTAALATLFTAERVWCDGGSGYSFGGVMPGGITFGMIARKGSSRFTSEPIEWTFHS